MRRLILEVICQCGHPINIRHEETYKGEPSKPRQCWKCGRKIHIQGTRGFVDNRQAQADVILNEQMAKIA